MTLDLSRRSGDMAMRFVVLLAALSFIVSIFDYFWTGNGIHGTEGALLVVVSTLLMLIASAVILSGRVHGWVRVVLEILILLDFLGTGLAAYLLESWVLLILDVIALVAWIVHGLWRARREEVTP
jgi:hypothetical protein